MTVEVKNTNEQEVKDVQPEKTDEKTTGNEKKTVGELLQDEPKKESSKPDVVGIDKFLELKKQNKELKKSLKDLEEKIADGNEDVDEDIDTILEEFPDVDKKFIKLIADKAKKAAQAELDAKLKPLQEEIGKNNFDKTFNKFYKETMEDMPEYKDIVSKDVIKSLATLKSNSNKTLPQLIEETYGRAIVGKKTVETAVPRGGKELGEIDFAKAARDTEYFKQIMADPDSKKKYNDGLAQRVIR